MYIVVMLASGGKLYLEVKPEDTALILKEKIKNKIDVPVDNQIIFFGTEIMKDDENFASSQNETVLYVKLIVELTPLELHQEKTIIANNQEGVTLFWGICNLTDRNCEKYPSILGSVDFATAFEAYLAKCENDKKKGYTGQRALVLTAIRTKTFEQLSSEKMKIAEGVFALYYTPNTYFTFFVTFPFGVITDSGNGLTLEAFAHNTKVPLQNSEQYQTELQNCLTIMSNFQKNDKIESNQVKMIDNGHLINQSYQSNGPLETKVIFAETVLDNFVKKHKLDLTIKENMIHWMSQVSYGGGENISTNPQIEQKVPASVATVHNILMNKELTAEKKIDAIDIAMVERLNKPKIITSSSFWSQDCKVRDAFLEDAFKLQTALSEALGSTNTLK